MYSEMTPEQLLAEYNRYEEMLHRGGRDYQDIPEHAFDNIERWLAEAGYGLIQPKRGLSTLKKLDEVNR